MDTTDSTERSVNLFVFSVIAVLVGAVTGFGAILFRGLIALVHNLFFFGQISTVYDANVYTPASPWGAFVILVPVVGGLAVVFPRADICTRSARPWCAGGDGRDLLQGRPHQAGCCGREIPRLGACDRKRFGCRTRRPDHPNRRFARIEHRPAHPLAILQRITLVAAGAGAGIAATFNTPIGGVIFAIELMMPEVSTRTFLPVALATGTATFIGRIFFGPRPAFDVPPVGSLSVHPSAIYILVLYGILGVLTGVAAAGFIRGLHFAEDQFDRIKNPYLRHAVGMTIVGTMMYAYLRFSGHYQIDGVGYSTIQAVLLGGLAAAPFLALLSVSKLVATSLSLGSGSSGGIFSPSLYMGATLGGAFGAVCHLLFPSADISVPAFAMVGMAAMVGGGTGAAMTAVTMIFEMTLDYGIVMPMIIAVAISIGCRRVLSRENIYTIKLLARRHFIPKALHANMFLVRRAVDVMDRDILVLPHSMAFDDFLKLPEHEGRMRHVVVTRDDKISGVLRVNTALRRGLEGSYTGVALGDVASPNFTIARGEDIMFNVIGRMWRRNAIMAVVVDAEGIPRTNNVTGLITKEHVADSVAESIKPYADADALL